MKALPLLPWLLTCAIYVIPWSQTNMTLALALGPQPLMPMYLLLLAEEYTWLIQAMQGLIGVGVSLALGASLRFAARAGLEVLDFVPQTSLLVDPCAYYRGPFCARHSRPEPWTITAARTLAATTAAIHPRPTRLSPADDDDPWRYAELACLWLLTAVSLLVCSVLLAHDEPWLALRRLYFINGASFLLFTMRYHWLGATAFPPYGSSFTIATLSWAKPLLVSAAATPDRRRAARAFLTRVGLLNLARHRRLTLGEQQQQPSPPRDAASPAVGPARRSVLFALCHGVQTALIAVIVYCAAYQIGVPLELASGAPIFALSVVI